MAKLDASVTVSVEKIYADAFKQMAKQLEENHGLYITCVEFDWITLPKIGGKIKHLHKVRVVTESY
jgi:hypothetical protein